MTVEELDIIENHMYLSNTIASWLCRINAHIPLDYNDLRSIGYLRMVEAVYSGQYKTARNLRAYLASAARHAMIDVIRHKNRYLMISDDDALLSLEAKNEIELRETIAEVDRMWGIISKLSIEEQLIIRYRLIEGLTVPEMAGKFGVAKGTVDKRIRRLKDKLKKAKGGVDV